MNLVNENVFVLNELYRWGYTCIKKYIGYEQVLKIKKAKQIFTFVFIIFLILFFFINMRWDKGQEIFF